MAFWEIVTIGVIGALIHKGRREAEERAEEERRRKNTPCRFDDGISEEQFALIAKRAGKHIKRLTDLSVDGPIVYGTVRTQSGLSEWNFKIDFNDYGHITGKYWMSTDNDDSNIPGHVADNICSMIESFPNGFEQATSKTFNTYQNDYEEDYVELDPEQEQENLRKAKEQVELFKREKKERLKSKIRLFFILLLVLVIACGGFFVWYKYQEYQKRINVGISSDYAIGKVYSQIEEELKDNGFTDVRVVPEADLEYENILDENKVVKIEIQGDGDFEETDKFPYDAKVTITYHTLKNISVPISSKEAKKMNYKDLKALFEDAGFVNINEVADKDLITGWITKDGEVETVTINGETKFKADKMFPVDAEVLIKYHAFKE